MRKKIPVDRNIHVCNLQWYEKATSEKVIAALKQMKEGEVLLSFNEFSGMVKNNWGQETEPQYHNYYFITVRSFREETDEEYLSRKKEDERRANEQLERDKLQYLNLKARFEPETTIPKQIS